jgi:glycosyltransferase 2 family protein
MTRVHLRWFIRLVASTAILAVVFSRVALGDTILALRSADPLLVLLGFLVVPLTTYAAAVQQKILTDLQGMPLSAARIVEINLTTGFYSLFLPGYLAGGLLRWHRMARPGNQPIEALAAIAFNRWLETVLLVVLGVAFWWIARPVQAPTIPSSVFIALVAGLVAVHLLFFHRAVATSVRARLGPSRRRSAGRLRRGLSEVLAATSRFDSLAPRDVALLATLGVSRHLLGIVGLVWLAAALGLPLSFAAAGWISSVLVLALMLPISLAGVGVRDAGLVVLLGLYGIEPAGAVALSFLLLARVLLGAAVGGLLEVRRVLYPLHQVQETPDGSTLESPYG